MACVASETASGGCAQRDGRAGAHKRWLACAVVLAGCFASRNEGPSDVATTPEPAERSDAAGHGAGTSGAGASGASAGANASAGAAGVTAAGSAATAGAASPQAGSAATAGAASPQAGGAATGGAASPQAGSAGSVPDQYTFHPSTGELAELLVGDWYQDGAFGDCYQYAEWYDFGADGRLHYQLIDDNACYGPMLLDSAEGNYTIDDESRLLELMLRGPGAPAPATVTVVPQEVQEHMTVAIGERLPPGARAGERMLDGKAFVSDDAQHFVSERYRLVLADGGEPAFEQTVFLTLELDQALPQPDGTRVSVAVALDLSELDPQVAAEPTHVALGFEFDAVVRGVDGWRQLVAVDLEGLTGVELADAYTALLVRAGVDVDPDTHASPMRAHFLPMLRFEDARPGVLSSTLPNYARLYKSLTPPPSP